MKKTKEESWKDDNHLSDLPGPGGHVRLREHWAEDAGGMPEAALQVQQTSQAKEGSSKPDPWAGSRQYMYLRVLQSKP